MGWPLAAIAVAATLAAATAAQPIGRPALPVTSPYLDAVRRYGPDTEREAIAALLALRLDDAKQVFDEIDDKVCKAAGAFSCTPVSLVRAGIAARERVAATWRQLYPRALALHVEAIAGADLLGDEPQLELHRLVVLRLIARLEAIAREPDVPDDYVRLAQRGRHLLVWAHQYLRDEERLASTLETFADAKLEDPEFALARGALEELRAIPGSTAIDLEVRRRVPTFARDAVIAQAQKRHREAAVTAYATLLRHDPTSLEAHLRAGRLLALLNRADAAEAHLTRVIHLGPDGRQGYLAALFMGDVYERQSRHDDALAAYEVALTRWPGAQAPLVALARLRGLRGSGAPARAGLAGLHLERDMRERSDPWDGYTGAQAWRLPAGIKALQASFEPLR
jgi:tetratricopeptide (TPR) repeat protein